MGDRYLRKLLVVGACATLRHRWGHNEALRRWASGLIERKTVKYKFKLTAVALANKVARIVYALMTKGGQYDDRPVAPESGSSREEASPQGEQDRGATEKGCEPRIRLGSPCKCPRRSRARYGDRGEEPGGSSSGPAGSFLSRINRPET
jgi:hypothetical protein